MGMLPRYRPQYRKFLEPVLLAIPVALLALYLVLSIPENIVALVFSFIVAGEGIILYILRPNIKVLFTTYLAWIYLLSFIGVLAGSLIVAVLHANVDPVMMVLSIITLGMMFGIEAYFNTMDDWYSEYKSKKKRRKRKKK